MANELWTPRPLQIEGANFICQSETNGRMILGDEMRLGKTGTIYLARERLKPRFTLLLCGKNAQYVWRDQAPRFGVEPPVIIEGKAWERARLWSKGYPFVTCTREAFKRDLRLGSVPLRLWNLIITDEAHRDTNRKTQNWNALRQLPSEYLLFATGSPMRRGPQNLWALLFLLHRKKWPSYWQFVQKYCHVVVNEWGGWEILGPKNVPQLLEEIRWCFLRRTFKELAPYLPPKNRDLTHKLTLTEEQERIYKQLSDELLADLPSQGLLVVSTVLAKIIRLRQLLICPRVLDPAMGIGACMEHFFELLEDADDDHCVVLTPFTQVIPLFVDECAHRGYKNVVCIKGGMHPDELGEAIRKFKEERGIAILSIQYAEAFDLSTATWAYFLGFEWDPYANIQAEDRLRGLDITSPTYYYYPQHIGCIDEGIMMAALDTKTNNINRVLHSVEEMRRLLKGTSNGIGTS